jgi:hypothetical protein
VHDAELTLRLGAALGIEIDRPALETLFRGLGPILTEWSINATDDPRGYLRFGSWVEPGNAALAEAVRALGGPGCVELASQVPHDDLEGIGLAFRAGARPCFRWWQLARPGAGEGLFTAARAAWGASHVPAAEMEELAERCGGPRRATALGIEAVDGDVVRRTVYFSVLSAWTAVGILERIGALVTTPARQFFRGLLGMDGGAAHGWPKVWIGRSFGQGGGWKFYWFGRGDLARPDDAALLDLVGAGPGARAAYAALAADTAAGAPLVQLVGVTFGDGMPPDAPPSWTLYLARR